MSLSTDAVIAETAYVPMSVRAIVLGWLVATGFAVTLYVGGLALGLTAFDAAHPMGAAKALGIGSLIWNVLVWAVSLFLGGLFASWYNAHNDQTSGSVHGVGVWGLSVTAVALLVVLGASGMHGRPEDGHKAVTMASVAQDSSALPVLRSDVSSHVNAKNPQTADAVLAALLANKPDIASHLLANEGNLSQAQAADLIQTWAADTNAAQIALKDQAQRVAHYTAALMWTALISLILSLISATLGGWVGAGHIHRIYHLRKFRAL